MDDGLELRPTGVAEAGAHANKALAVFGASLEDGLRLEAKEGMVLDCTLPQVLGRFGGVLERKRREKHH